jgi:glucans biosynthesis protein
MIRHEAMSPTRREMMSGLAAASALAITPAAAQQATNGAMTFPGPLGDGQRFEAGLVQELAAALAKRPMAPNPADLPDGLNQLTLEALNGIRMPAQHHVWAGEQRGFTLEPLHRGGVFSAPVALFVVDDGAIRRLAFDKTRFEYGRAAVPSTQNDLGFSGFRLAFGMERPLDMAIFQGASFFRAIARGQTFGAIARTLVLRAGEQRGEEIPFFRAFWIERPAPAANAITLHALVESESCTAAVRMTFRPGDITINDVELTLYARVQLENVGFAGVMGNYLFSPQKRRLFDEMRPAAHEVAGLQMRTGADEWVYRPLNNPEQLQISAFIDQNPRGFGLVQRDRDFAHFLDDDQRYDLRPSVWMEPLGEWGSGVVQLFEIPTDAEINDNIISYWRPRTPLPAGSATSISYRQFWCWALPEPMPVAFTRQTRQGRGSAARRRRFSVEFQGETLADAAVMGGARVVLSATPGAIHAMRLQSYPDRKSARVTFELEPGPDNISELRLQVVDNAGKPLTETWLNRWTP